MPDTVPEFPGNFLWGASTAAYQVEGGNERSAFWAWEERRRWERSGEAAGSWTLFDQDLALLKTLGANAYRFSIEWSRLEPEPGRFDARAFERYRGWCRGLSQAGIRPMICLHHFSEPAWLEPRHPGGWQDPETARAFLRFVERAAAELADDCGAWLVFNEPMVFLVAAYGIGLFPPGRRLLLGRRSRFDKAVELMAQAYRGAFDLIRRRRPDAKIGLAQNVADLAPARPGDEPAVEAWDLFMHRRFLDLTRDRLDFLGINYYTRIFVTGLPFGAQLPGYAEAERWLGPLFRLLGGRRDGRPRTGMDWEVVPEGLGRVVSRFAKLYRKPILITENGMAAASGVSREEFLREHLRALAWAMREGAEVIGYLHWSLLDNYEWGSYAPRFGLFDRKRRPCDGSEYFARVARSGRL